MKKEFRLLSNTEFSQTITQGKKYLSPVVNVFIIKNNYNKVRVGISTPTKIGHAVVRNRARRQIRSIVDSIINYESNSLDIVLIVKEKFISSKFDENKCQIEEIFKQIGIINEKKN